MSLLMFLCGGGGRGSTIFLTPSLHIFFFGKQFYKAEFLAWKGKKIIVQILKN